MDSHEKSYSLPLLNDSAQTFPVPAAAPLPATAGSPADQEEVPASPKTSNPLGAGNLQQFCVRPLGSPKSCPEIRRNSLQLRREFFESLGADGESRSRTEIKSCFFGKGPAPPVPRKPSAEKIAAVKKRHGSLSFGPGQGLVDSTKTGHPEGPEDSIAHVAKGWSSELNHIMDLSRRAWTAEDGLPRKTGSQLPAPATAGPVKPTTEQRVGFGITGASKIRLRDDEASTKANERGSGSRIPDQEGQSPGLGVSDNGGNPGSTQRSGGKGLVNTRTVVFKSDASTTLRFGGRPGGAVKEQDWFRSSAKVQLRKPEVASALCRAESSPGLPREIRGKPVKVVAVVNQSPKLSYCQVVERHGPLKTTSAKPEPVEKTAGQSTERLKLQSSETPRRSDSRTGRSLGIIQGDPASIPGPDETDHEWKGPGGTERRSRGGSGSDDRKTAVIVRSLSVKNRIKCFEMLENRTGKGPAQPDQGKPGTAGVSSLKKSFSDRVVWHPGKETPSTDLGKGGRKPWEASVIRTTSLDGRVKRRNPPFGANGESRKERNAGKGNDGVANQGRSQPSDPRSTAGSRGDDLLGARSARREEEDDEFSDTSTVEQEESSSGSESDREVVLDSAEPNRRRNANDNPIVSSDSGAVDKAASSLESSSVQPGRAGVTPGSVVGSQKLGTPSFLLTSSPVVLDPAGLGSWPSSLWQWTPDQSDGSGSDSEDSVLTSPSELSQADARSFSVSLAELREFGLDSPRDRTASLSSNMSVLSFVSLIPGEELDRLLEDVRELGDESLQRETDVQVVVLHKEEGAGLGFSIAGGVDQNKPVTVHKVFPHGIAAQEGTIQQGDTVLSINGSCLRGSFHCEALRILRKARLPAQAIVVLQKGGAGEHPAHGGPSPSLALPSTATAKQGRGTAELNGIVTVELNKDSSGLGFSLEGGKGSSQGDRPITVKKVFLGGPVEAVQPGDEILEVHGRSMLGMMRLEAWKWIRTLPAGPVTLVIRKNPRT